MRFISTGISGLDELLGGGVGTGSTILLIGRPGTGKFPLCNQFIYGGLKQGQPCTYISTMLSRVEIKELTRRDFGWDFERYEREGLLRIVDLSSGIGRRAPEALEEGVDFSKMMKDHFSAELDKAKELMRQGGRVAFHTLTSIFLIFEDTRGILRFIHAMRDFNREMGLVALCVLDAGAQERWAEEYMKAIFDYVIETDSSDGRLRLRVVKGLSPHDRDWHPFDATREGVKIIVLR